MRNLNLDQVQTLIAIADLGTLAAAARALHLAPPTVSLHIKELESRLGAPLLHRGRRHASLTTAGSELVEGGRQLLTRADEIVEQVHRRSAGRSGTVRLGSCAGVSAHLLPQVLSKLEARSPGLDIKLDFLPSAETMACLRAGTLDIGIVAMPQAQAGDIALSLWRNDPMVAFVPEAWKAPRFVTPEWLAERPWVCLAPTTQMYRLVAAWFGQAGLNPRPRMHLNYPAAVKSMVAAGQAAAVLPMEHPAQDGMDPAVLMRRLRPALNRPLGIAYRKSRYADQAVMAVLQTLGEFAGGSVTRRAGRADL